MQKFYPRTFATAPRKLSFQAGYRYSAYVPSVSLMSETEQWLDNHYVYRGNANLQPYKVHASWFMAQYAASCFQASLLGLFNYSPGAIVNYFERQSGYILQSYGNLGFQNEAGGQLIVDWYPLSDKRLKLHFVGIYMHHHGKERNGSSWNGYRYQLMASASYATRRWLFEAYYQYPGQIMQGQLVTPRAEVVSLDVAYRPTSNMSIGLQWMQPFMNGFEEGEHTTESAIIQSNINNNIRDMRNMLTLKFTWNLSFGKRIKTPSQRIHNSDNDSGLLTK